VHGCFWHRHPSEGCKLARLPKSRGEFWIVKLNGNRARDMDKQQRLRDLGWEVLVLWECELKENLDDLRARIREFLGP
jgi:DNA mismatch endonuclease (patch repair protein)